MCYCHCRQSLSGTLTVDAPRVSAAAVWEVLTQVEAYPDYMSQVSSIYWPHGRGTPMQQGYSWRETRIFDRKCHVLHKTVTQLSEPSQEDMEKDASTANYSVSINVAMDVDTSPSYKQVVHTCSITIIPYREQVLAKGSDSRLVTPGCRLLASWCWLPAGWYNRLEILLLGRWIKCMAMRSFEVELEEMAAQAVVAKQHMAPAAATTTVGIHGGVSRTVMTVKEETTSESPMLERVEDATIESQCP